VTVGDTVGVGVEDGQSPILTIVKGGPYNSTVIDSAHIFSEKRGGYLTNVYTTSTTRPFVITFLDRIIICYPVI
jgi:hypothetical protein